MVEQYGIPKNLEELDPTAMPFISYLQGDKLDGQISEFMSRFQIPVVEAFHIAENICPHIIPIHDIGGKVILHQTIHFDNDQVFKCSILNELDHIVAPTVYAKKILTVVGKVKADNITVIPHGVDTKKFYPHQTLLRKEWGLEDKPVILYCGRLDTWKGVHQLISVFKPLIRDYNAVFIIRGEDFSREKKLHYIFSTIDKRNPNVIYLSQWESPSFIEELMATGVVNEEQDVLVPRSEELYGGLKMLLEDPERCKMLGYKGRKKAMEQFDLTNITIKWHNLFNSLVGSQYSMDEEMSKALVT